MKFLILLGICLVTALGYDNVRLIRYQVHEDYPGKCYHNETEHAWDVDEVYTPVVFCVELTCQEDSIVRMVTCPNPGYPHGCTFISGDKTKAYPLCCAKLECIDADGKISYYQLGE